MPDVKVAVDRDNHSALEPPANPVHLQWKDVSFEVADPENEDSPDATKTILHKLSGQVAPGELVAIMGPSGSGKTSLLNVLAQRNISGVTGNIELNNAPIPNTFRRICSYVTQNEEWFGTLTVRETLMFAAELRLPYEWSKSKKMARVDAIMDEMDLGTCKDTYVGEVGNGISGGERRRLAIGIALLNEPPLLMLDEPTSGLDAASALMVVEKLKLFAQAGRTILCTIHQPRSSVLALFDKVLLLAEGKTVFFGPSVPHCLEFFTSAGYECPRFENPADFMLDLVNTRAEARRVRSHGRNELLNNSKHSSGIELPDISKDDDKFDEVEIEDRHTVVGKLCKHYSDSKFKVDSLKAPDEYPAPIQDKSDARRYVTPFHNQAWVVFKRSFLHKLREPIALMTQAFNATVMPFLAGTIYWQMGLNQAGADNRISAISFLVLLQSFFCYDILLLFPIERSVYLREQAAGMYRTSAYYFGRTFAEMPAHIVLALLTGVIAYWSMGLQSDAGKFFIFEAVMVMVTLVGASLLLFFGAVSRALEQSNLLATLFIILFMLFDGNWVAIESIPAVYRWIHHLSFLGYGVRIAIDNEFRGLTFHCDDNELVNGICPFTTGEQYLKFRQFDNVDVGMDFFWLIFMGVVYRAVAYVALRFLYTGKTIKERLQD